MEAELLTTNDVAEKPPKFTAVVPMNSRPVIVTVVPPVADPLFGETDETTGAGTCAQVS